MSKLILIKELSEEYGVSESELLSMLEGLRKKKRGRPPRVLSSVKEKELSEKKKRGRPRKTKSVESNKAGEELIASLLGREEECESRSRSRSSSLSLSEEVKVKKYEIDGKWYLKSEENILYDIESHDEVGRWDEELKKIVEA